MEQSLDMLRKLGYRPEIVEHRLHIPGQTRSKITRDLFGFADILALKPGQPPLLVQTTSQENVSTRAKKIQASDWFDTVKLCGFRIVVHGWGDGGLRVVDLTDVVTDWSTVVKAGRRSKNRPRVQQALPL